MTGKKRAYFAPSATPWDGMDEDTLTPAERLVMESHRSAYRFKHERFDLDVEFFNSFEREACPHCASPDTKKAGQEGDGLQRYRCNGCGRAFTPTTGTIFEARKLPLSAWTDFLIQAFSFESIAVMTRDNRRSGTTVPYWLGKVFAILEGVQDGTVLSGDIQIDETYYPVPGKDTITVDGKRLRGLSRNKICVGIGCDGSGASYFANEGLGKTSSKRTMEAFGAHIAAGSHLTHDMEKSHRCLVKKFELVDDVYNSKKLVGLDDRDNPLGR
jgi:hypothetical protein